MPVTLSIATVIELGGHDHLPDEFKALFARAEEVLYPPWPSAVAVAEGDATAPPAAPEPDLGALAPLEDWLIEHAEPELVAAVRWLRQGHVPICERKSYGTYWIWSEVPRHLRHIQHEARDTFLQCLAIYACELLTIRREMGL